MLHSIPRHLERKPLSCSHFNESILSVIVSSYSQWGCENVPYKGNILYIPCQIEGSWGENIEVTKLFGKSDVHQSCSSAFYDLYGSILVIDCVTVAWAFRIRCWFLLNGFLSVSTCWKWQCGTTPEQQCENTDRNSLFWISLSKSSA